jgi:hypothetical protein
MTAVELITALFYEVDEQLRTIPKHPGKRNKKVALKPRPRMRTAGHALLCPSR